MRPPRYAFFLASIAVSAPAWADLPPPKVCVVVQGDPDPAVQSLATELERRVAGQGDLRGVVDSATRAVLRGESPQDPTLAPLAGTRRHLTGSARDASVLDGLGTSLGCTVAVELASRPTRSVLRSYDLVHRTFGDEMPAVHVDDTLFERLVRAPARQAVGLPATEPAAIATDAPAPNGVAVAATGTTVTSAPAVPSAAASPTTATTAAPTALPSAAAAPSSTTSASPARVATPPSRPASGTAPASSAAAPAHVTATPARTAQHGTDPRVAPDRPRNQAPGWISWAIAGGAAAALVAVFVVAESVAGGSTTIHVNHPANGDAP